jgi:ABC-2 type transport system permease protein
MSQWVTLARREFWEHRSLWLAPLIAAGVLLVLSVFGAIAANRHHFGVPGAGGAVDPDVAMNPKAVIALISLAMQIFLVAAIAAVAYLLDCLYAERKDRSILFWKSLPVSDAKSVLVKFGVAMLVVPMAVFVVAAVTFLLVHGVVNVLAPDFVSAVGGMPAARIPGALAALFSRVFVTLLWYAPVATWLMLASVLARRSPWLIVSLVPLGLVMAEGVLFQTRHVLTFLAHRLTPVIDPLAALQGPALWLGLVAAAGMLYIVIRLRRYRDDT